MQIRRRQLLGAGLGASALIALPGCSDQGGGSGTPSTEKKVEVFSWWSGPGEGEGLAALIAVSYTHLTLPTIYSV